MKIVDQTDITFYKINLEWLEKEYERVDVENDVLFRIVSDAFDSGYRNGFDTVEDLVSSYKER